MIRVSKGIDIVAIHLSYTQNIEFDTKLGHFSSIFMNSSCDQCFFKKTFIKSVVILTIPMSIGLTLNSFRHFVILPRCNHRTVHLTLNLLFSHNFVSHSWVGYKLKVGNRTIDQEMIARIACANFSSLLLIVWE